MEFEFSYKKIKISDIEALEEKLFVKFPKDYVDFLLSNNGGRPAKERYLKKDDNGDIWFDFNVNALYGIAGEDEDDVNDIYGMYGCICDRIPGEFLPIGDDGVGDFICLGVEGEYHGKVYLWWEAKQADEGEPPNYDALELLDDSFAQFMKRLC